jgi:DNA-binding NarL/FixJ family response regulator
MALQTLYQTLEELIKLDPQVRTVVCSGYSSNPVMANHLEHGFSAVLPKPFKLEALDQVLRELMT